MISNREKIYSFAAEKYGVEPEYLWKRFPGYAVLRRSSNSKWFAIIMDVPKSRLGISNDADRVDIMNVKIDDFNDLEALLFKPGILRGYHSGRGNWISVLLDGTVDFKLICDLLDSSYSAVGHNSKKRRTFAKEWLVPANPRYYDVTGAFDSESEIVWKQGRGILTGDIVYLYAASPVSAVLFKCAVSEINIPCDYKKGNIDVKSLMRLKLLKKYPGDLFTFALLKSEYGVGTIRGPRGVPHRLSAALDHYGCC
jgi:predicted DNA-binding protein (MmcQ/YjbR family)